MNVPAAVTVLSAAKGSDGRQRGRWGADNQPQQAPSNSRNKRRQTAATSAVKQPHRAAVAAARGSDPRAVVEAALQPPAHSGGRRGDGAWAEAAKDTLGATDGLRTRGSRGCGRALQPTVAIESARSHQGRLVARVAVPGEGRTAAQPPLSDHDGCRACVRVCGTGGGRAAATAQVASERGARPLTGRPIIDRRMRWAALVAGESVAPAAASQTGPLCCVPAAATGGGGTAVVGARRSGGCTDRATVRRKRRRMCGAARRQPQQRRWRTRAATYLVAPPNRQLVQLANQSQKTTAALPAHSDLVPNKGRAERPGPVDEGDSVAHPPSIEAWKVSRAT